MEHNSECAELSHHSMENHSDTEGTESEEASTASDDDVFTLFGIHHHLQQRVFHFTSQNHTSEIGTSRTQIKP